MLSLFDKHIGQDYVYGHQPKTDHMTDKRANESESAAQAALREPFRRASESLAAWSEDLQRTFPHADIEFFPEAGSKWKTSRAALRIMFTRAVIGEKAKPNADYAGLWVVAQHHPRNKEVMFEIRPYLGPGDKFGTSHRSNNMPRFLGFKFDWWTHHDLPLFDQREGFRQEFYFSADGRVPREIRHDLNTLYYYGYAYGLFEDPVKVLESQPGRPGMIPE